MSMAICNADLLPTSLLWCDSHPLLSSSGEVKDMRSRWITVDARALLEQKVLEILTLTSLEPNLTILIQSHVPF